MSLYAELIRGDKITVRFGSLLRKARVVRVRPDETTGVYIQRWDEQRNHRFL